ncbi:UNVERIFIED_CONTAM: hypothetical protein Slati_2440200 [Sesamum latifolium]|uniref:Uncharacterized protein n=1 Tax=Sesamum latifolium TaxID=2727402 RepID=A0AAW2WCJ5_9LAMI
MQQNLLPGRFKESIAGKPPTTMEDLLARSQKYIRIEESNASDPSIAVKRKSREDEKEPKKKEERKHVPPMADLTRPLERVRRPTPHRGGYGQGPSRQPHEATHTQPPREDNLPTAGVIAVISGGPVGGDSANARKALARAVRGNHGQVPMQVHNVSSNKLEEISFGLLDLDTSRSQNNDALSISATLSNFWVKKVLVDSGSSTDIIFYDAYVQLGIDNAKLRSVNTPLMGFSGEMIEPLGEVMLPLSLGSYPKRSTKLVKFLVVKASSAYNIILGRLSLNLFRAIASTLHMKLKFPTSEGIGEAIGDERMARECYVNTLKRSREKLGGNIPVDKGKKRAFDPEPEVRDAPEDPM